MTQQDPVCGAQIEDAIAVAESEYLGARYYFCSLDCQQKFDQRPEDYIHRAGQLPEDPAL